MKKLFTSVALLSSLLSVELKAQLQQAPFVPPVQPMFQLPGMPLYTINAQIRTRSELRNGLGNLQPNDAAPSFFTSQRTNLNFGFRWEKLNFNMDVRDVRVWGQDASTINNNDGSKLFLHQAWAEFVIAHNLDTTNKILKVDNLSVKVGRQEINYEDARLLGNLDWLQQARRHDAVIVKLIHKGYRFDLGFAMNQNNDQFNGTLPGQRNGSAYLPGNVNNPYLIAGNPNPINLPANFVPTNAAGVPQWAIAPSTNAAGANYKFFQYLYATRRFNQTNVSMLLFKDDFQKARSGTYSYTTAGTPNVVTTSTYDTLTNKITNTTVVTPTTVNNTISGLYYDNAANDVVSRYTVGGQFNTQMGNASDFGRVSIHGGGYYQFGRNRMDRNLSAWHAFANAAWTKGKFTVGPGIDILSGNSEADMVGNKDYVDQRFDPLYGTPHRWWGYMDFFYVGTGAPNSGLVNPSFKTKYQFTPGFFISLDGHAFLAQNQLNDKSSSVKNTEADRYLGYELDFIANYQVNRFVNLELGYSFLNATNSMNYAKDYLNAGALNKNYNTHQTANWAYLMLNIRPDFLWQKPVPMSN